MLEAYGVNSPELNSFEVLGAPGGKGNNSKELILQTALIRCVSGLLAMDTIIFSREEEEVRISFHAAPGSSHLKEEGKYAFVLHGVPVAVNTAQLADQIEKTADCQLLMLISHTVPSKLLAISTAARVSSYRYLRFSLVLALHRELPSWQHHAECQHPLRLCCGVL